MVPCGPAITAHSAIRSAQHHVRSRGPSAGGPGLSGPRCGVHVARHGKLQLAAGGRRRPRDNDRRRDVTEDTAAPTAPPGIRETADYVQVKMPAESAYLSVLRTAAAGLAARLDFTLDEIEDLRIAIDEACAMLLAQAIPGTDLECVFELDTDLVTITVSVTAAEARTPARDTFAWTVLSALAGSVDSRLGPDDRVSIVLAKRRGG